MAEQLLEIKDLSKNFRGLKARAEVVEGQKVVIGEPLFSDIRRPAVRFCSSACGEVISVKQGDDGLLEEVRIAADGSREEQQREEDRAAAREQTG